jgi:hypothetical protein
MGFKYRRAPQDFYAIGPANEIRETQYGNAVGAHIFYPGVSTCTTITLLLADGSALGMHLAKTDLTGDVDAIVAQLNVVRAARAVSTMYAVGVLRSRSGDGWMGEPATSGRFNSVPSTRCLAAMQAIQFQVIYNPSAPIRIIGQ